MWETLRATLYHNRRDIIMLGVLALISMAIFAPIMTRWQVMGDYTTHNQLALQATDEPARFFGNTPHFLYHVAVSLAYQLGGRVDVNNAAVQVLVICFILTVGVIYWQLRAANRLPGGLPIVLISGVLSLALAIIMPINFFTPENLYFGYLVPHVYHNPTMIIMKPLALVLFFLTLPIFFNSRPLSRWWIIPLTLLTVSSMFAKPSFVIAFVPTLGLICFVLIVRYIGEWAQVLRQPMLIVRAFAYHDPNSTETLPRFLQPCYINWPVLLGGIVLPTFIALAYQMMTWTSSGGIGIDPLRVLFEWTLHYEENADQQLLYKFGMSLAFPSLVYLLHLPHTLKHFTFNLAWALVLVSAGYLYLLVDYTVIAAGDFGWSVQIAVLILFIVAVRFILQHYEVIFTGGVTGRQAGVLALCTVIFALHGVAGIHWYRMHMSQYMEELLYIWW
ncbi:MAG: hypothetical protein ACFE0Q_02060 [Anaerolineae bacterium]